MKIAIQISGEFRVLHHTWQSFQEYLVKAIPTAEVDCFVHTWTRPDDGFGTWAFEGRGGWHNSMYVYGHDMGLKLYRPKAFFLENYEDRKELHDKPRAISMYYSIWRANEARKAYEQQATTKYDLVVRYRTDLMLKQNPFDLVKEELEAKRSFLCIPFPIQPKYPDGPVEQRTDGCICDWFAFGTPDAMEIYCTTVFSFFESALKLMPESMLAVHLKKYNVSLNTILKRPDADIYLVEGNGNIRGV